MRVPVRNLLHHPGQKDVVLSEPDPFIVNFVKHVVKEGGLASHDRRNVLPDGGDKFEINILRVSDDESVIWPQTRWLGATYLFIKALTWSRSPLAHSLFTEGSSMVDSTRFVDSCRDW